MKLSYHYQLSLFPCIWGNERDVLLARYGSDGLIMIERGWVSLPDDHWSMPEGNQFSVLPRHPEGAK